MTIQQVRALALKLDQLIDQYIEADRWIEVRDIEQRLLLAYGNAVAMQQVLDDYVWPEYT